MAEKIGPTVVLGGIPVDLTCGILDAMLNPPPGFKSKFRLEKTDLKARIARIPWFAHCGEPMSVDLTRGFRQVPDWSEATRYCKSEGWADAGREAQNQLTRVRVSDFLRIGCHQLATAWCVHPRGSTGSLPAAHGTRSPA